MTYPMIQPTQPAQNSQGTYQAQVFGQNQAQVFGQNQNQGIAGGQGGQGMVAQPIYQLTVQQPGIAPQGEQGGQQGTRNQGSQGVQEKAKELLENLLAQYNNN